MCEYDEFFNQLSEVLKEMSIKNELNGADPLAIMIGFSIQQASRPDTEQLADLR